MRTITTAAFAVLIAVLTLACKYQPVPGHHIVAGDSIALLAGYYGGDYHGATLYLDLGARARTHQARVDADVNSPTKSPDVLVMAYGHNYVASGMSPADIAELDAMLLAPHEDACTVVVLPAYTGTDALRRQVIARYHTWAQARATAYPERVRLADWATPAEPHPEWFEPDGYHPTGDPALRGVVADAFTDVVAAGVAAC